MAIPTSFDQEPENDDFKEQALAQSYYQMSISTAYKDLTVRIEGLISAAKDDLFGCDNNTKESRDVLFERWRQREFAFRAIQSIVNSYLNVREQHIAEAKEQENTDEHSTVE